MRKRIVLPIAVLAAVGIGAILWGRTPRPPAFSLQTSSANPAVRAWPTNQHWDWTFPLPEQMAEQPIRLEIRQKSMPLQPGVGYAVSFSDTPIAETSADRSFGTTLTAAFVGGPPSGAVSVQLIDLSEVGAVSAVPGKSLRVMATLSMGGGRTKLSGDATILAGESFTGSSIRNEGAWVNGELFLMSFWVKEESCVTRYDVLLEKGANPAATN
jgi:hypothetical protein